MDGGKAMCRQSKGGKGGGGGGHVGSKRRMGELFLAPTLYNVESLFGSRGGRGGRDPAEGRLRGGG